MRCRFTTQRNFRSVDAINARFAAGGAAGGDYYMSGKEAQFHQSAGNVVGKIETIEGAGLALFELSESPEGDAISTHLQH